MVTNTAESRFVDTGNEESSGGVSHADKGRVIRNRRVDAGIKTRNQLAALSGFHRDTIKRAEEGRASDATYDHLMAWLDKYMGEPADQPAEPEMVEFRIEGDFGVRVVVRGPIADHETLREDVAAIIRSIREGSPPEQ